jgi:hypothetical protein
LGWGAAPLFVGAVVIFELIFANGVNEANFLFIKLTKFSFVEFALPAIIAYLYYSLTFSAVASLMLEDTHRAVVGKVYPRLKSTKYLIPLQPANSLSHAGLTLLIATGGRRSRWLVGFSGYIGAIFIGIAPPVFLIVAYIQLFIRYGIANPLLWVSLFVTATLMMAAFTNFYVLLKMPTED